MLPLLSACLALSLQPLEKPPVLSSPVFALATLDADGKPNMNMLTYATPVGIKPERLWAVSIFRETLTHANWLASGTGVLQQLADAHAPLTFTLGGSSGAAVDKARACAELGFAWEAAPECGGAELVLPGCVAYLRLVQRGELIRAGEHDVAICAIEKVFSSAAEPPAALSTEALRSAGLVSDAGRAIAPG